MVLSSLFPSVWRSDSSPAEVRAGWALAAMMAASLFWSTAACELAAGGLVVAAIIHLMRTGWRTLLPGWTFPASLISAAVILCGIYAVGDLLSIMLSPFPAGSGQFAHLWHVLIFPAFLVLKFRAEVVRFIGGVFVISGSLAAIAAIVGYLAGTSPHLNALFVGNTTFADLLVLAAILLFGSIIVSPPLRVLQWRAWQLFFLAVPMIVGAFLSALRTPVTILVAMMLALTLLHRPRVVVLQAAVLGGLMIISPLELWLKFAWLAEGHSVDRYILWRAGLDLLPRVPLFGFGAESYARILPPGTWESFANRAPASWHNDFLAMVLGSGWLTGIAYTASIGLITVCGIVCWAVRRPSQEAALAGMLGCLLSALLFFSLFNSVVTTAVLGIVLWTLLGLLASTISGMYRDETPGSSC